MVIETNTYKIPRGSNLNLNGGGRFAMSYNKYYIIQQAPRRSRSCSGPLPGSGAITINITRLIIIYDDQDSF